MNAELSFATRLDRAPAPSVVKAAAAEYDRLGAEIDALADRAKAARTRGDRAEAERLGAECRELVFGPYARARKLVAALLEEQEETEQPAADGSAA